MCEDDRVNVVLLAQGFPKKRMRVYEVPCSPHPLEMSLLWLIAEAVAAVIVELILLAENVNLTSAQDSISDMCGSE